MFGKDRENDEKEKVSGKNEEFNTSQSDDGLNKESSNEVEMDNEKLKNEANSDKSNSKATEDSEPNIDNEDTEKASEVDEKVSSDDLSEKEDGVIGEEVDVVELLTTIARLEEKINRLEAEKEALNNRLQRLQADFSNYRKRTDREMGRIQSNAVVELIREFLPVIDNFERALTQKESGSDFVKGVEMIYKQIITFLEKQGVEIIEAVGEDFDHNYHNAVMQVESDEHDSGEVIEELQKGYILGDTVVRPAMVKVAE